MVNTKAVVLLIAGSIVVAAMVGVAFAQTSNAYNSTVQTPQDTNAYPYPQQGYCPYSNGYGAYPYCYGNVYGRGGCGC
jgi:hypothetical protein